MKIRVFRDVIIYGMSVAIAKLLLFVSVPIFTRIMSVEEYGIISFLGSLIGLIAIIMKIGTNNAVQRYYFDVDDGLRQNVIYSGIKILFFFSTTIFLISLLMAKVYIEYFSAKNISFVVLFSALLYIYLLQYIIFLKDVMRLYIKPWIYLLLEITPVLSSVVLAYIFIYYFKWQVEGYFFGYAFGTFLVCLYSLLALRKYIRCEGETKFIKELVSFGYPFIFVGLASWVFQSADRWMLLELISADEVGIYSVSYQISSILLLVVTTFGIVWAPYALKLLRNHKHKEIFSIVATLWYLVITYVAFILSLFFNNIVTLLLDERYLVSIEPGVLLTLTMIFIGTVQISVLGISIAKKTKVLPWITAAVALVNIILNYYLIPQYLSLGAAFSTLVCNLILTILYFLFSQKYYYIAYNKAKLFLISVVCALFYGVLLGTDLDLLEVYIKVLLVLFLSVFYIPWMIHESRTVLRLVNIDEK